MRNSDILTYGPKWNKNIFSNEIFILRKKIVKAHPNLFCAILNFSKVLMEIQSRWIWLGIMYIRVGNCKKKKKITVLSAFRQN